MASEGFDQIQISCVVLQQEKPVQNQKTDYPVKFNMHLHCSGYLWICLCKIREKLIQFLTKLKIYQFLSP